MSYAQDESCYYLTPVGWRRADAPGIGSTRYEAWLQLRVWRLPWSRERVRWECLWADVAMPRNRRDALRSRHPFPAADAPTTYGRPK